MSYCLPLRLIALCLLSIAQYVQPLKVNRTSEEERQTKSFNFRVSMVGGEGNEVVLAHLGEPNRASYICKF